MIISLFLSPLSGLTNVFFYVAEQTCWQFCIFVVVDSLALLDKKKSRQRRQNIRDAMTILFFNFIPEATAG